MFKAVEEKRHQVMVNFQVLEDGRDQVKTLGKSLFFGKVKTSHLPLYEKVLNAHLYAAEQELLKLQEAGKFR